MRVWDVDPRATLPVLRGHTSYVYPVAYSPDGRWIASGSWDNTVRLWDAATGEPCATLPHPGVVHGLAFSPDGDVAGDRELRRITGCGSGTWRRHASARRSRCPAGTLRFVTVSPDGAQARRDGVRRRRARCIACTSATSRPASGCSRPKARPWPTAPTAAGWPVRAADDKTVLLLDARTHETAARFRGPREDGHRRPPSAPTAAASPRAVRTAPSASGRLDGGACRVLRGHTDEVFAAAFHPDGTRLATAGRDRAVWLWDLARGEEVARLQGHTSYVWSLAFSPDGATLASGSGDFTVRLWDTAPLKSRYQARREAEALRPEAERLVEQLWRQKNDPAEVVEALRADRALSEPLRQAALRAVLRRTQPPEAAPGNPHDPP